MTVLVISPFRYALKKQVNILRERALNNTNNIGRISVIYALPNDIEEKVYGKSFDVAYVDKFYNREEINMTREHITGKQIINLF